MTKRIIKASKVSLEKINKSLNRIKKIFEKVYDYIFQSIDC